MAELPLAEFNAADPERLRPVLTGCLAVPRWVDAVLGGRPYASAEGLLAAAELRLRPEEIHAAMAAHPRIGDKPAAGASRAEQSGVDDAAAERFREANAEYERRFGHVYLVCAAGRSGDELLADLASRLDNDPATELAVAGEELVKIARLRLAKIAELEQKLSLVTTHVLDNATGRPATGVPVALRDAEGTTIAEARTDDDGRVSGLGPEELPAGTYRLVFDTGTYFGAGAFFPEVTVAFHVGDAPHYHVPLLLSPYSYTTYRGS